MSDSKSKMPDLNEIGSMVGKLFGDIKKSVVDIVDDFKNKHPAEKAAEPTAETKKTAAKKDEDKK